MAAGITARFRVKPGRRDEFLDLLRAQKAVFGRHGAEVRARQVRLGGENAGIISFQRFFEDGVKRGAHLDAMQSETDRPLQEAMQSENPPANPVGRSFLNEVNPGGGIPADSFVSSTSLYQAAAGRREEALGAFEEVRAIHEGMGGNVSLWQLGAAGANQGAFLRVLGHDSWTAQAEFQANNAARDGVKSIGRAVQSGTLVVVSGAINVALEL